ncbi:hypothetical protein GCM10011534_03210 [Pseudooceanicola nanhaiensis]|uniref:Uncharacterized protein n=1 Tax=Pseudooceanicola nanhaiensis TaxID=375761 RepID=A0A917SKB7_9RHOB|nr:hypothetical protein GCM10011534_03210 [Pseudooceanicola nanhaiensis]
MIAAMRKSMLHVQQGRALAKKNRLIGGVSPKDLTEGANRRNPKAPPGIGQGLALRGPVQAWVSSGALGSRGRTSLRKPST